MSGLDLAAGMSPMVKAFLAGSMSGTCSTLLFQVLFFAKAALRVTQSPSSAFGRGEDPTAELCDPQLNVWRSKRGDDC